MGILLSIVRYLGSDENQSPRSNDISSPDDLYNHYSKSEHGSRHQWQNENNSTHSHQMKYLTISVPNLSLMDNSANHENVKEREKGLHDVTVKCRVAPPPPPEGRWIKHYSSCHRILLVGEGDFSFSTCLAAAFGMASNMVATSLNSKAFLVQNYGNALANLVELSIRKCRVMHEVDATKMATHEFLGGIKFDRIIFNFPFAGFFRRLSSDSILKRHRRLVRRFLKNAKEMISENGEIHISHKTNGVHIEWDLETLASSHGLRLIEAVDFKLRDYPGYNTKGGFGGDGNFNCYPSKTYKFGLKC